MNFIRYNKNKGVTIKDFKKCSCTMDSWQVIVVDHDEYFHDKSIIYYHCGACAEDFTIVDFYTQRYFILIRIIAGMNESSCE